MTPDTAIDPRLGRPTVDRVLPLVDEVYRRHLSGCCLHIVLDDGNLEDSSVAFCLETAEREGCEPCVRLCKLLADMTTSQRSRIYRSKRR